MRHGQVIPNEDGSKARCGGPGICTDCSTELALVTGNPASILTNGNCSECLRLWKENEELRKEIKDLKENHE
jgi:hypothetical protein